VIRVRTLLRRSLLDVAGLMLPVWFAIVATHTIADADLWGHLRFGSDLLSGRGLPSIDPYSFTADVPWINHEWLSEAAVAMGYAIGGALALNLLKLAVILAVGLTTWRVAQREHASPFVGLLLTSIVVFASYTRTQVLRPQLFSVLLFTLLIARLLQRTRFERVAIPLLFCIWANAHGAWIVGFAALSVWLAADVFDVVGNAKTSAGRTAAVATLRESLLILLASLAATLVNPYGTAQWTFLHETVGLSRAEITDWVPFVRLPAPIVALDLVLPLLAIVASVWCRRKPSLRQLAVPGVLAFGMWRIGRVDAFLQIAIGLLFAPVLVEWFGRIERALRARPRLGTPSPVHGLVYATIVAATIAVVTPRVAYVHIEGPWIPDADAVRFLRADSPRVKLLTWFDWGEYAIWHLAPSGIRVSMDGRRETVYSDRVLRDHWSFYRNEENAWTYPDAIGADRIWLPKRLPIVQALRAHGWHAAFESDLSIVLTRESAATRVVLAANQTHEFFPGP
jgi:hypothetical protein